MSPLLGAALAAGAGLGLLLVLAGLAGIRPHPGRSGDGLRPLLALVRSYGLPLLAGIVAYAATSWPAVALDATAVVVVAGPLLAPRSVSKVARRAEAVADWVELVRDSLGATAGLTEAIQAAAPLAPPEMSLPAAHLAMSVSLGDDVAQALGRLAAEVDEPAADKAAIALSMAARSGSSDLGPLLSALARSTRAEVAAARDTEAARARAYSAARTTVVVTLALVVGFLAFDGQVAGTYATPGGQLVLLFCGATMVAGLAWMRRLANPPRPLRLLAGGRR